MNNKVLNKKWIEFGKKTEILQEINHYRLRTLNNI